VIELQLLLYVVLFGAVSRVASVPRLLYSANSRDVVALAFDSEVDAPVLLERRGEYGPTLVRRVEAGRPGAPLATIPGAARCYVAPCLFQFEYSRATQTHFLLAQFGQGARFRPELYEILASGQARLIARAHLPPLHGDESEVVPAGVVELNALGSFAISDDTLQLFLNSTTLGAQESTVIDLVSHEGKGVLNGRIVGVLADGVVLVASEQRGTRAEVGGSRGAVAISPKISRRVDTRDLQRVVGVGQRLVTIRQMKEYGRTALQLEAGGTPETALGSVPIEIAFPGCKVPFVGGAWPGRDNSLAASVDCDVARSESDPEKGAVAHQLFLVDLR
jgi:hypothetical protein